MVSSEFPYQDLLKQVSFKLMESGCISDSALLARWRILHICQYLVAKPNTDEALACKKTLENFLENGLSELTINAIANQELPRTPDSILPVIDSTKRKEVIRHLELIEENNLNIISDTLEKIPNLEEHFTNIPGGLLVSGIKHRINLLIKVVVDINRSKVERSKACAAIQYVDEIGDIIPDDLGLIGLLDDDYVLRFVLKELGITDENILLHWSEHIITIWEDLPFLKGVNLKQKGSAVFTSWLDRLNAYIAYSHVLNRDPDTLHLLQPSKACSPLYTLITLMGFLILDGLTSNDENDHELEKSVVYEIDGKFYAQYDGISTGPYREGFLRFKFQKGLVKFLPFTIIDRIIPIKSDSKLSKSRDFENYLDKSNDDPIQRFFGWNDAIGAANIPSRLVLVTSRETAAELFNSTESNNTNLLKDGLVKYLDSQGSTSENLGGLILIAPTVESARLYIENHNHKALVVIDGYERLSRGKYDIGFLLQNPKVNSIICYSPMGYYPRSIPFWMPKSKIVETRKSDLRTILELDHIHSEYNGDYIQSMVQATRQIPIIEHVHTISKEERVLLDLISQYSQLISTTTDLPEYLRYFLKSQSHILRILIEDTPAKWSDIKSYFDDWSSSLAQRWSNLPARISHSNSDICNLEDAIFSELANVDNHYNTKGTAFLDCIASLDLKKYQLVCNRSVQVKMINALIHDHDFKNIYPVTMNGVNLCSNIIVSGWSGEYFARNIFACTPKLLIVLTDSTHQEKWQDVGDNTDTYLGKSILDINNGKQSTYQDIHRNKKSIRDTSSPADTAIKYKYSDDIKCSECIFLGLSEETEIKILARGSHVIVQDQEKTIDKRASNLVAGDKVILDLKSHQSSPAEQFTEAFIRTVESTNPQVVEDAKTWRLGLQKHLLERNLSMSDLRQELLKIGIERDVHTIQGWLDCERQSPIAPLHYRSELELMWNMIGQYTSKSLEDVIHACSFLRSLRHEASKALLDLLMGDAAKLSGENRDLEFLVYKLREDVQAHEIEFVSEGKVPSVMLGWWVNIDIIDQFLY